METVGEIIRSEREKKGLSIKDAEHATSIRALYLTAIEEGNYKIAPGEVYLKGFIRNYANYLGLDGTKMVDLYRQSQMDTEVASVKTNTKASEKPPNKTVDSAESEQASTTGISGKWLVALLITVCIAGGAWFFLSDRGTTDNPVPAPPSEVKQVPPPIPALPPAPPTAPSVSPQSKPVVVMAKFTDECWALITADGKEIYEGIPKIGESFTWEAQKDIVVKLGNAGAVDLVYNGQPVGKLGGRGDVVIKSFSANIKKP